MADLPQDKDSASDSSALVGAPSQPPQVPLYLLSSSSPSFCTYTKLLQQHNVPLTGLTALFLTCLPSPSSASGASPSFKTNTGATPSRIFAIPRVGSAVPAFALAAPFSGAV